MKKSKKTTSSIITRSSTAEYLTFISATGESAESIEVRYEDKNIWMTQKMMAQLYDVSVPAIRQHLDTLIKDSEINTATIKQYLIVQKEGGRTIKRKVDHYNLQAIISIGFKIENERSERHIPLTMKDWAERLDRFIEMTDRKVLQDSGRVTRELAREFAETEFEKYRIIQDRLFESDFDKFVCEDGLKKVEGKVKGKEI